MLSAPQQALIKALAHDYRLTYGNPMGEAVLADLSRFCRATESTFHPDARIHAVLEGRREVWLRIRAYLDLDDETLLEKLGAIT